MKIGGLQPITLLDYPHKIAAIVFTSGCNMRCPFCYNPGLVVPSLIKDANLISENNVLEFLDRRKKYLEGVVITGGEPMIQKDIIDFLIKIKKLGYSVKIDTNGLAPNQLKKIIDSKLVDYIAMDIKGPADKLKKFSGLQINSSNIEKSIKLVINSGLPYEFRSTVVKNFHSLVDIKKMSKMIDGAKLYWLQNFNSQEKLVDKNFCGQSFTKKEMKELCDLAGQNVKKCNFR